MSANEAPERVGVRSQAGPELSLGMGWGDPHGQREEGEDLTRVVIGQVAVEAAAGWRTDFGLHVTAHGQYGWIVERACPGSCSSSDIRLGLGLEYHFTPGERIDHYVGLGAGYEWLTLRFSDSHLAYRGPVWLAARLGEEFAVGPLGIGPVMTFTIGRYTHASSEVPPIPRIEAGIENGEVHVWFFLGVRASFGFGSARAGAAAK